MSKSVEYELTKLKKNVLLRWNESQTLRYISSRESSQAQPRPSAPDVSLLDGGVKRKRKSKTKRKTTRKSKKSNKTRKSKKHNKLKQFVNDITSNKKSSSIMPLFMIGVPTTSTINAIATENHNKSTLEMLLRLQTLIDEFKKKVIEMEEELHTARLENTLLKNKILELTSSQQQRRGFFGYGIEYKQFTEF